MWLVLVVSWEKNGVLGGGAVKTKKGQKVNANVMSLLLTAKLELTTLS